MKNGRGPARGMGGGSACRGLESGGRAALWGGVADGAAVGEASGQPGVGEGGMGEPAEAPAARGEQNGGRAGAADLRGAPSLGGGKRFGLLRSAGGRRSVAGAGRGAGAERAHDQPHPGPAWLTGCPARVRRKAPVPGWYLPAVREGRAELDSFDVIEDLPLEGFGLCQVFTGRALRGAAVGAWPTADANTTEIVEFLQEHWRGQDCRRMPSSITIRAFRAGIMIRTS